MDKPHKRLNVWKKGIDLVTDIYSITRGFPRGEEYALSSQLRRASISIPCNIAEGFERETDKEFIQFLIYARGSVGELKSHLYVALDLGYLQQERFQELHDKAVQVAKLLNGFIAYLRTG